MKQCLEIEWFCLCHTQAHLANGVRWHEEGFRCMAVQSFQLHLPGELTSRLWPAAEFSADCSAVLACPPMSVMWRLCAASSAAPALFSCRPWAFPNQLYRFYFMLFFKTGSCYVTQPSLNPTSSGRKEGSWDYRPVPLCAAPDQF
jgi:hypothetical protein